MRIAVSVLIMAALSAAALAHPSTVPHAHPHGASVLPDIGAIAVAALLVGAGVLTVRYFRKARR